jgi:hypothetical protein
MIVGVLTTCHTQYTSDSSICIFLFNRTTLQVFVTYRTGALYVHHLLFYKHQHDNRFRNRPTFMKCKHTKRFLTTAILVNCAPSGEMHNYCKPHTIKDNFENFLIHRCNYILLSQVYCVWQVVKTLTVILNNTLYHIYHITYHIIAYIYHISYIIAYIISYHSIAYIISYISNYNIISSISYHIS